MEAKVTKLHILVDVTTMACMACRTSMSQGTMWWTSHSLLWITITDKKLPESPNNANYSASSVAQTKNDRTCSTRQCIWMYDICLISFSRNLCSACRAICRARKRWNLGGKKHEYHVTTPLFIRMMMITIQKKIGKWICMFLKNGKNPIKIETK